MGLHLFFILHLDIYSLFIMKVYENLSPCNREVTCIIILFSFYWINEPKSTEYTAVLLNPTFSATRMEAQLSAQESQ